MQTLLEEVLRTNEEIHRQNEELKSLLLQQNILRKENLTFDEGCQHSGISRSHMYKLTSQGRVPHYRNGKAIVFKRSELDQWQTRRPVRTLSQIEAQAATRVALT